MAASDVSVIIIEELPQAKFAGTRLELRGGGLPKQGAPWGGKHRVITKYYVGNPVATQQSLGPTETAANWEGAWHRNMLEDSPAVWIDEDGNRNEVVHPHILMQILDDIRFRGYALRVTWSTKATAEDADVQIVREGKLTSCDFPIVRIEDIDWKATFEWKSRGQALTASTDLSNINQTEMLASWQIKMNQTIVETLALKNKLDINAFGSASDFSLDQLFKLATYPQTLVDKLTNNLNTILSRIQDVSSLVNQAALTPAQTTDKILSIANNALAILNQFNLDTSVIPAEYHNVDVGSAADVARNAKYFADIVKANYDALIGTQQIIIAMAKQKQSRSAVDASGAIVGDASQTGDIQLYKVLRGDTALSISQFFYNSSDYAGAILKANHLSPYTVDLDSGSIIVIPKNPQAI